MNKPLIQHGKPTLAMLFASPFRIFFVSAALWALLAVGLWAAQLAGALTLPSAMAPLLWHQHEMLFGFLNAAIAGFLLTAVCNWTGTERLHGAPLLLLWLVWFAGRLLTTFAATSPEWLVLINLAFLPLVMLDAARRIFPAKQHRQLIVLLVVTLIWLMQASLLLQMPMNPVPSALIAAMLLMLVIGGRITPAFSINWLKAQGRPEQAGRVQIVPWLERLLLTGMLLLFAALAAGLAGLVIATLAGINALLILARLVLWRGWLVRQEPLLWILHLSLLWIPLSLILLLLGEIGSLPGTVWIHALALGAMASLILGVMSRVALGHTGRPLSLPSGMLLAFLLIQFAAVVRVLTAANILPWQTGIIASSIFWSLAFALFLWRYSVILMSPRVDGKAG